MRNSPSCGCCYCSQCRLYFDDFNRADSTTIGAGWSETAGAWEVESSVLITSSDNAVIKNGDNPYGFANNVIRVQFKGLDAADEIDVLSGIGSGGEYLRFRFTLQNGSTCGTITVTDYDGATATDIGTVVVPQLLEDVWHSVKICHWWDAGMYLWRYGVELTTASGIVVQLGGHTDRSESRVGLGTGAITTKASFDDFCWQQHSIDVTTSGFGPNQCPSCAQSCGFSDGHVLSTGTDLGCAWNECSGNWSSEDTGSGYALTITTATSLLLHNVPHPLGKPNIAAEGYVKLEDDADTARIWLGREDCSTGGVCVELECDTTCGVVRFFRGATQVGGDVPIAGLVPDAWHHVAVCYGVGYHGTGANQSVLSAVVTTSGGNVRRMSDEMSPAPTGTYAAFEVTAVTTKIWFRGWEFSKSYDPEWITGSTLDIDCDKCVTSDGWCVWGWLTDDSVETCEWSDVAGVWSFATTSSDDAIKRYEVEHPYRSNRMRITGTVTATGEAVAIAYIAYENSTTHLALRIYFDDATCPKVELAADGVVLRTVKDHRIVAGETIDFCLQYDGTEVSAWYRRSGLLDDEIYIEATTSASADGLKCAIGTGTVTTGSVTFSDVTMYVASSSDMSCDDCDECVLWYEELTDGTDEASLPCSYGGTASYEEYTSADTGSTQRCAVIPAGGSLTFDVGTTAEDVVVYVNFSVNEDPSSLKITACGVVGNVDFQGDGTADIDVNSGTSATANGVSKLSAYVAKFCAFSGSGGSRIGIGDGRTPANELTITPPSLFASADGTGTLSGTQIKLEAITEDVYIHSVKVTRHYKNDADTKCGECFAYCAGCEDGITPAQFLVVFSGCSGSFFPDVGCCSINGSYYVTMDGCTGTLEWTDDDGDKSITVEITLTGENATITVSWEHRESGGGALIASGEWGHTFVGQTDCNNLSNQQLTVDLGTITSPDSGCADALAATVGYINAA